MAKLLLSLEMLSSHFALEISFDLHRPHNPFIQIVRSRCRSGLRWCAHVFPLSVTIFFWPLACLFVPPSVSLLPRFWSFDGRVYGFMMTFWLCCCLDWRRPPSHRRVVLLVVAVNGSFTAFLIWVVSFDLLRSGFVLLFGDLNSDLAALICLFRMFVVLFVMASPLGCYVDVASFLGDSSDPLPWSLSHWTWGCLVCSVLFAFVLLVFVFSFMFRFGAVEDMASLVVWFCKPERVWLWLVSYVQSTFYLVLRQINKLVLLNLLTWTLFASDNPLIS